MTDLYEACHKGDYNLVDELIKKGVNNWNDGLFGACRGGHKELVQLMISYGANNWNEGLCYACYGGHKELVLLMIVYGANDWNGGLAGACHRGNKELVLLMIEKGAQAKRELDWTWALSESCVGKNNRVITLLMIEKGANIDLSYLKLYDNELLYLIQKGFKNISGETGARDGTRFGKYQEQAEHFIGLRKQESILLEYILINDLIRIIMSY